MPLIEKPNTTEKEQLRVRLDKNVLSSIKEYCEWADISHDHFFEQASLLVFKKDKEWQSKGKNV